MIAPSKPLFIGLIVLAFANGLRSQEVEVKNVRFKQGKDSKVIVTYDLLGDASKKHMITLSLFRPDTKETAPLNPKNLFGDVGKNVSTGRGKKIVWDLLKDFPKGLHSEGFVFTIDADAQKGGSKLPWIAGGVVATGGLIALIAEWIADPSSTEQGIPLPPALP
jgi:hypothetical protein